MVAACRVACDLGSTAKQRILLGESRWASLTQPLPPPASRPPGVSKDGGRCGGAFYVPYDTDAAEPREEKVPEGWVVLQPQDDNDETWPLLDQRSPQAEGACASTQASV